MITQTQLNVLATMAGLKATESDTSIPLTIPGMTVDQLSDALGQLLRLGAIRHFYDLGAGEVSVFVDDITPFGYRILELNR